MVTGKPAQPLLKDGDASSLHVIERQSSFDQIYLYPLGTYYIKWSLDPLCPIFPSRFCVIYILVLFLIPYHLIILSLFQLTVIGSLFSLIYDPRFSDSLNV